MTHRVTFTLDLMSADDAVQDNPVIEITRILQVVADQILHGREEAPIYDLNGNKIGQYYFEVEDDE